MLLHCKLSFVCVENTIGGKIIPHEDSGVIIFNVFSAHKELVELSRIYRNCGARDEKYQQKLWS